MYTYSVHRCTLTVYIAVAHLSRLHLCIGAKIINHSTFTVQSGVRNHAIHNRVSLDPPNNCVALDLENLESTVLVS